MTTTARDAAWRQLTDAGLVTGDMPAPTRRPSPWYVRAMLGIAGWMGAMFLIGFVGAAFVAIFSNGAGLILAGAIFCGGAFAVFRVAGDNDFAAQFGLALSLAGQVMVGLGVFNLLGDEFGLPFYAAMLVFECGLVLAIGNFLHRVWSAFAAMVAIGFAMSDLGFHGLASGLAAAAFAALWLRESAWIASGALWRPVAYGVTFALLWFDGMLLASRAIASMGDAADVAPLAFVWLGPVLSGVVLVSTVARLLALSDVTPRVRTAALGFAALVAAAATGAPGVATGLLTLVVGFALGHRVLVGLGVAALLGYLGHYYYSLHMTLLAKSGVLVATGTALVAAWVAMRLLLPGGVEDDLHA